ncbi:hypothetical protein AAFF_G00037390 [Aldrovandia affinis]|uniref:Calpain-9-like n=1 Tax=Aldrovandia affinis TaxID=143900 RepID=A0AAD7WZ41_9TELE|nr:hypothetical protein AAFF_G00037390 [Aldrovandia affinis]
MSDTNNSEPATGDELPEPSAQQLGSHGSRYQHCFTNVENNFTDDRLFVDHTFPTGDSEQPDLVWRRPKEICPSAQFIVDGATRMDVCQGILNDCWFLSAVASLSLHHSLLERVVPAGQSFGKGYTGCFTFRFWQYGEWQEVKIDDLLPTRNGQLVYLSSSNKAEFWSPLLEKAYAKLKGGYRALNMGFPHEAMVDMTGGVAEVFSVATLPSDLVGFLQPLLRKGALINCANSQGPLEQKNKFGILFRHAYSLTGVEKVKTINGNIVELVRVHNPWGKVEWEGPWSDMGGPEWCQVSEEEQWRVRRVKKEDGEFWMSVADFCQNFEIMEVCHLSEDTLSAPGSTRRPWRCALYHGSWVPFRSAGGPPRGGRYNQNPQFHLTLLEEDDDPGDPELTCSFLVALMQKHTRRTGVQLNLNLHIYQARSESSYLSLLDLAMLQPVISLEQNQRREVLFRGRLAPGHYIIIPSTAKANQEGEFILRILTEEGNKAMPADKPDTDGKSPTELAPSTESILPSAATTLQLFKKHCNSKRHCRAAELLSLLREAIGGGVLAGYEKGLCLEHCKSFVALMDSNGMGQLDWEEFQLFWEKIRKWTDIFVTFDKNRSQSLEYIEISPALTAAGLWVDEFVIELIGLRYTEPDMTVSYSGFLYLLLKLDSMIQKFHSYDMVGMGTVSVNYRQWLHMTMYN